MCDCEESYQSELEEKTLNLVNGQETFRISPTPFGSGQYGDYYILLVTLTLQKVYHAFWQHRGICVAVKEYNSSEKAESEIKVLARINNADDHIIHMHGYQEYPKTIIIMELGGMNFDNYFSTKILEEGENYNANYHENFLTYMLLCAAQALEQFHKLLSRKIDIYAFGVTIYKFLFSPRDELRDLYLDSLKYQGRLGQLAKANINLNLRKACLRKNPHKRPEIEEVICFLMKECNEI
uniref:Protein kinase domain-containing protein n=1 Tax=Meloidogyne floridensis TaxID=298350 RepID=A0A915NWH0_9BILA